MEQGKVRKRINTRATAAGISRIALKYLLPDDFAFADEFAQEKAKTTFHRVMVDQILPTTMTRDIAFGLLEEHVTNNILKVTHP